METMIDITPRNPIPTPAVGPLHAECGNEGLIICDRQKIKGIQGVSLDALVGIFTRLGRDVEEIGVANTYALAVKVAAVIEEAKPLLTQVVYTHLKFSLVHTIQIIASDVLVCQVSGGNWFDYYIFILLRCASMFTW